MKRAMIASKLYGRFADLSPLYNFLWQLNANYLIQFANTIFQKPFSTLISYSLRFSPSSLFYFPILNSVCALFAEILNCDITSKRRASPSESFYLSLTHHPLPIDCAKPFFIRPSRMLLTMCIHLGLPQYWM